MPEFVFENLCSYLVLLKQFSPTALEERGSDFLEPVLTALVLYMGSNKLVRNPHLRAKLAECMDCLLPTAAETESPRMTMGFGNFFYRTKLFNDHPYRHKVGPLFRKNVSSALKETDTFHSLMRTSPNLHFIVVFRSFHLY